MPTDLRKRVADLLHTEHRVSLTRLSGLSVKDIGELRAVASGEREPEYRVKALGVLAALRDPAMTDVFRSALRDTSTSFEVRAAGATWLSRLGGMAAEGELMASLTAEQVPVVQHKIVAGLARMGSEASLRRLAEAVQSMDPDLREHARFAQAVIAYRAGISGYEIPVVDAAQLLPAAPEGVSARGVPARSEDALRVIEQTFGDNYQVAGDPEGVATIQCGRRNLAVVTHVSPQIGAATNLLARPSLAGYVAVQAETDGSYSTGLLVLTWPDGGGSLHVSVNRPTGRTEYFGKGTVDGATVYFTLDAVRRPGATETTVTGTVAGVRIAELQVSLGRTQERMRPMPMEDR